MANRYRCSSGETVTQSTIDKRRSDTYREMYSDNPMPQCSGCEVRAQGSAHILPQARCKQLGLTELCWSPINIVPTCHSCNSRMENISSKEIRELRNIDRILSVYKRYDPERYQILLHNIL